MDGLLSYKMATIPPTPSTLRSWEEAFNHPLPVVRRLETQLRTNIADKQNKLRSLVGTSYRDLLGTAERIIEMDTQMQLVESNLTGIGRKCDYRWVERETSSLAGLKKAGKRGEAAKLAIAAKVKVLTGALDAVERIVRKRGDAFAAAKLLVLARLLHKSVSEGHNVPAGVEELRRRLASLRKVLLGYIERALARTTGDRVLLANTLCAYAMVTSSAPKDVLRHFLQVRCEQLDTKAETPTEENVRDMLEGYGRTRTDTRELFPKRFADALAQVSKAPLLHDAQITSVVELNLDIYERWIPDDIRTFTPYVRHDQLAASEASDGLKSWAKQAQTILLQAVEECLQSLGDIQSVLSARHGILSRYLAVSSQLRSDNLTQPINDLRQLFSKRLEDLVAESAEMPREALGFTSTAQNHDDTGAIWSLPESATNTSNGARALRVAVISKRHGRDANIQAEHYALNQWVSKLDSHWDFIAEMRATKWDDDLEFDLDDLDYEGDESLAEVLSKKDPAQVEAKLRTATAKALQDAYSKVDESSSTKENAAALVRTLREIDSRRHVLGDRVQGIAFDKSALVPRLHAAIAEQASQAPVETFMAALTRTTAVPTTLWDGSPPLPVQPSTSTFKFLTTLQRSMAAVGEDIWSAAAVGVLKAHVCSHLSAIDEPPMSQATANSQTGINSDSPEATEDDKLGEKANSDSSSPDRNALIQRTFDAHYLARALSAAKDSKLRESVAKLSKDAEIDEAARQRLAKSANEYWKRTYLLFGLLAPQGM